MIARAPAFGPAAVTAGALIVPLLYVPPLDAPFLAPKLALLFVCGGLAIAGWLLARVTGAPPVPWSGGMRAAAIALVGTTVASALIAGARGAPGAPYAHNEIFHLLAAIGIAVGAGQAAADPQWRRRLVEGICVAAGIVSLVGLLQHVQLLPFSIPVISVPGSTFGNRNMAGEAVALSIPFGLAAFWSGRGRRWWPIAALVLVQLLYLAVTRARGAWLGGAAGVVVFLAVRRPRLPRAAWVLAAVIAAGLLAAALLPGRWIPRDALDTKRFQSGSRVVLDAFDPSSRVMRTRSGLWRRTLAIYGEHPLTGVGSGNFPVFFTKHAEPGAAADGVMSPIMVPRQAHNEALQRLAETGPLGLAAWLAVFVVALAAAFSWSRRGDDDGDGGGGGEGEDAISDRDAVAAAGGAVAACLACGATAFPLSMPATTLLFGVGLGFLATLRRAPKPPTRPWPRWRTALTLVAVVLVVAELGRLAVGGVRASYWFGRAEDALAAPERRDGAAVAMDNLARAERADPGPGRFAIALRTGQVAIRLDRGAEGEAAADRALALEPFSPHAFATRASARLAAGNAQGARDDAQHALALFADYPGARFTLGEARRFMRPRR